MTSGDRKRALLIVTGLGLVAIIALFAVRSLVRSDRPESDECVDCPVVVDAASPDAAEIPPEPEAVPALEEDRVDDAAAPPNTCLQCHPDAELQSGTFDGSRFAHSAHVGSRLPCTRCHTSFDDHGGIILASRSDCSACHHAGAIACSTCHGDAAVIEVIALPSGDFAHGVHVAADLPCSTCHGEGLATSGDRCGDCHEAHHDPAANCTSCHRDGAQATHTVAVHTTPCASCHGERLAEITAWSRNICESCHARRSEHYAGAECSGCHVLPSM